MADPMTSLPPEQFVPLNRTDRAYHIGATRFDRGPGWEQPAPVTRPTEEQFVTGVSDTFGNWQRGHFNGLHLFVAPHPEHAHEGAMEAWHVQLTNDPAPAGQQTLPWDHGVKTTLVQEEFRL